MNWQKGLERMSAVWWGLWGLACLAAAGAAIFGDLSGGRLEVFLGSVCAGAGVYLAHRITCWVVAGFFSPR